MEDHRKVLRRVGQVLIIIGMLDIGLMVYCIANGKGYASSLNVFAVYAGVCLWRGSLRSARLVARYAAFGLVGGLGFCLFVIPFLRSADLWVAEFRLHPVITWLYAALVPMVLGLFAWVYRELRSPVVLSALAAAGEGAARPTRYIVLGAVVPLALALLLHFTLGGERGAQAIELAQAKYGDGYRYNPISFSQSGTHATMTLDAYNGEEIRSVTVSW